MVDFNRAARWLVACGLLAFAGALSAQADVTVFDLTDTENFGASGGIRGYSVGTSACNIGNAPLNWCAASQPLCSNGQITLGPSDHPVIAQNLYRIKNGRFEHIGASWLKHGFASANIPAEGCGNGICQQPPLGGSQMGVGCVDPYFAGLNGARPLGRRSEVNPTNGAFPIPMGGGGATSAAWHQRIAVAETDLAPAANPGARYFIEGHYIAADEALAGNGLNNASYREVVVAPNFNLDFVGKTVRESAAIFAWQSLDPSVAIVSANTGTLPNERFHIARRVAQTGPNQWHYEYAVHNLNSDRAADRLLIDFAAPTVYSGIGFRDVDAHSNEPYDTSDWGALTTGSGIEWRAPSFSPAADANALRWGTVYSFWFDATNPPSAIQTHELRLFKAGSPSVLRFDFGDSDVLHADGFE